METALRLLGAALVFVSLALLAVVVQARVEWIIPAVAALLAARAWHWSQAEARAAGGDAAPNAAPYVAALAAYAGIAAAGVVDVLNLLPGGEQESRLVDLTAAGVLLAVCAAHAARPRPMGPSWTGHGAFAAALLGVAVMLQAPAAYAELASLTLFGLAITLALASWRRRQHVVVVPLLALVGASTFILAAIVRLLGTTAVWQTLDDVLMVAGFAALVLAGGGVAAAAGGAWCRSGACRAACAVIAAVGALMVATGTLGDAGAALALPAACVLLGSVRPPPATIGLRGDPFAGPLTAFAGRGVAWVGVAALTLGPFVWAVTIASSNRTPAGIVAGLPQQLVGAVLSQEVLTRIALEEHVAGGGADALARDRFSAVVPFAAWLEQRTGERESLGLVLDGTNREDFWRVAFVVPQSPAASAGLRRGQWVRFDETAPDPAAGVDGPAPPDDSPLRVEVRRPDGTRHTLALTAAAFAAPRIVAERTFDLPQGRAGYVVFTEFDAQGLREFVAAAQRLRAAGATALVVDLRWNEGGLLDVATQVGGAIAGHRVAGEVFARTSHHPRFRDRDVDRPYRIPPGAERGFERVVFLTGRDTCSASEALIVGLRRYMPVRVIGERTCGKPFGGVEYRLGEDVHYVTSFRLALRPGESDYADGLAPDVAVADDVQRELGDPEEPLLGEALRRLAREDRARGP
jgi:C-terminal processing protease CtpA/Prc